MTSAQRLDQARTLATIVREMAKEIILPRYLRAVREHKADGSVLTEADLASQAALVERLPQLINAPVLGEEMTAEEQGRVWHAGVHGLWVIDPIDGTTNFANGIPFFGVAVAYLVNHKTQIGVVYNPVTDEAFYAARGAGDFIRGERIGKPPRQQWIGSVEIGNALQGVALQVRHPARRRQTLPPPCLRNRGSAPSPVPWRRGSGWR